MPPRVYVPIIPNYPVPEHQFEKQTYFLYKFENRKSKVYKPQIYIQSYVKYKDTLPTYEAITPKYSTEIDKKLKIDERPPQKPWDIMVSSTRQIYW